MLWTSLLVLFVRLNLFLLSSVPYTSLRLQELVNGHFKALNFGALSLLGLAERYANVCGLTMWEMEVLFGCTAMD